MRQNAPTKTTHKSHAKFNIPIEVLIDYRTKGLTQVEIARICGCARETVSRKLSGCQLESLPSFVQHRAEVLAFWQRKILSSVTPNDIKKANFASKMAGFGILYDKERLERGQSTGNIGVIIGHIEMLQRGGGTIQSDRSTISTNQGNTDVIDISDGG